MNSTLIFCTSKGRCSGRPSNVRRANYRAADYVIALPLDALAVLYTDGIAEHQRDPIRGEAELIAAAKIVHGLPQINAARAIARRVFRNKRGDDDAAALGFRTLPREPS